MKFRVTLIIVLTGLLITAIATRPGYEAFIDYINERHHAASPPVIKHENNFVYSKFIVTSYQTIQSPGDKEGKNARPVAVETTETRYLGLFGRFWKMD